MAELKTKKNNASVSAFLKNIPDEKRRTQCQTIFKLMKEVTNEDPKMWGTSIVGFGSYHYKYPSGREGDWFIAGFSPRKQNLTLHIMPGLAPFKDLLAKLGKHKTGQSCLYINKLEDIDMNVLRELLVRAFQTMKKMSAAK